MLKEIVHFQFFGHTVIIYGYGLMLVLAFVACVFSCKWLAKRNGINPDLVVNAVLIGLITGILGARICHILENLHEYTRPEYGFARNLIAMMNLSGGGLTFYGGVLLATPSLILYAWANKIPILRGMDIVAPVLMIGLGVGRIGCFLNGCCYGEQGNLPWCMRFPYFSDPYIAQYEQHQIVAPPQLFQRAADYSVTLLDPDDTQMRSSPHLQQIAAQSWSLPVEPTQIYSSFTAFLLAGLLISYLTIRQVEGRVFALMLILEGGARFVLELIRVEPPVWTIWLGGQHYGMSISMVLGVMCIAAGIGMWMLLPESQELPAEQHARLLV